MTEERINLPEFLGMLAACWLVTLAVIVAKIAKRLGEDPIEPIDPVQRVGWQVRRKWLLIVELASTPALALGAVILTHWAGRNLLVGMASAYVAAALGLPLLTHGIMTLVGKRVGLEFTPVDPAAPPAPPRPETEA